MLCIRSICCLLLCLPVSLAVKSQVSFTLYASPSEIFRDDELQVTYTVHNAEEASGFVPPVFAGWNIVSGPSFAQEQTIVNGQSSKKISYLYVLAPKKAGRLSLPATSVIVNGRRLFCQAVPVTVLNKNNPSPIHSPPPASVQLPSLFGEEVQEPQVEDGILLPHEKPDEKIRKHIFVKAFASKNTCYAGEPVLVTYKLYTSLRSESRILKQPAFSGCSVTEMTTEEGPSIEQLNGKNYRVFLIRKVQLVPLQPGKLKLDAASVENQVQFVLAAAGYQQQTFAATLQNPPISLQVKPLPAEHRPVHFSGIVGQFSLHAAPRAGEVPAGENNSLLIDFSGKGNISNINLPVIEWPAGLDHFEATSHSNIDKLNFPVSGTKTFEIPIIGTKEGAVAVPPIHFNYFDPEKAQYRDIQTDSILLHFGKAANHSLKKDPNIISDDFTTRRYLWIVPAIALAVVLIWWLMSRRDTRAQAGNKPAKTVTQTPFHTQAGSGNLPLPPAVKTDFAAALALLTHMEDHQLFYGTAKQLLAQCIREQLHSGSLLPESLLQELLLATGNTELVNRCRQLFNGYEHALYAPFLQEENRQQVMDELTMAIHLLTKH